MKRHTVVRVLSQSMAEGDMGVFIGEGICKEAYAYDRPGNFYITEYEGALSMALGLAMCSNRRVFVFCDDAYFIRNISEACHMAISGCENLYLVVLVSGIYSEVGNHPTIFKGIRSSRNMLFNMGFVVHNYKRQFQNMRNPVKEIRATWSRVRGPLAIIMDVEYGVKKTHKNFLDQRSSIDRIMTFIINEEIPNYEYIPPMSFEDAFPDER
jgi:hypothetical protein